MSADEGVGASMATTNGERSTATPDPSTLATPGKRKRVSSQDDKEASAAALLDERAKLQETLRNLIDILSKNDTELQLLSCPLPLSSVKHRSKRAKTAGDKEEAPSIQARVASDRYNTLPEFLSDIEKASSAVIGRNKPQASGTPTEGTPVTETVNRIAAFKKVLNNLVRQAHVSPASVKAETPGNETETSEKPATPPEEIRNNGMVLTLFGNPANPKQLYSSLQKSVKVPLSSDETDTKKYVEVQTPLPEGGLPNGITTTKITPHDDEKEPKPAQRTFGEVFAPKATLPPLDLPRRARSTSRAAQVSWIDPFDAITNYKGFLGDRNNYAFAHLPSGNWLQYGGTTSSPSFWNRRQKQQTPQQHGDEKHHEDPVLWPDDDASVLQGVYSSFAPSFDSSAAVVQADSKNLVWWNKRGAKRLNVLLSLPSGQQAQDTTVQPGSIGDLDESTLEEMVNSYNPDDFADASIPSDTAKDDEEQKETTSEEKETADLLSEISDLLETLSSYQRIRNLEFSPPSQKQGAEAKETPSAQPASDRPSNAEQEVYETLRSSLSLIVSQLPPFAVAKLDGDQLADLNISQNILIENADYAGTMERDDHTIQQERATAAAANPVANRTSTPSRPANYQAQYNQRAFGANARIQPQGSFSTPQPYYPPRQPSTPANYTPGNPQPFPGARPSATPGQRPGYYPGYGQSTPQFGQGNSVAQYQRPGQNGYNPYTPQAGANPGQGSPQQYASRPGQPTPYNVTYTAGRGSSPQKQPPYVAPRAPFMSPGSNPQQRFMQPQQSQTPQQYAANYTPNQTPSTYSNSAAAMTYARSAAEQAALMDRNRVQLAAQGSPSTPQPQPADYRGSQDGSVTPGTKQNGTPVPS